MAKQEKASDLATKLLTLFRNYVNLEHKEAEFLLGNDFLHG